MSQVSGQRYPTKRSRNRNINNHYYMSGAHATMPDIRMKEALRLKPNGEYFLNMKVEERGFFRFPKMSTVAIIFILAVLVAAQYNAVQTMGYKINTIQNELTETKASNEKLEREYAALSNLTRIEKIATKDFGMIYPKKIIAYHPTENAPTEGKEKVVVKKNE